MLICFDGRHVPDSSMPIVEPDGERLTPFSGKPKKKGRIVQAIGQFS